ncbi:unnamed protein product [Ranitomeya imitator]|uniref:DEP domain-containing protein n=1 Tax=Ranitomeya imitator TaxID=111125 RepID=A0ABN9MA28_9NEOB|nr:unnamed protein product [Ranitomeya imitator]
MFSGHITINYCKHLPLYFVRMMEEEDCILQVREEDSAQYKRAFISSQIVDWLVDRGEVASRADGETLCRTMLQYGIIHHDPLKA